jgi:hypothetical protein
MPETKNIYTHKKEQKKPIPSVSVAKKEALCRFLIGQWQ